MCQSVAPFDNILKFLTENLIFFYFVHFIPPPLSFVITVIADENNRNSGGVVDSDL